METRASHVLVGLFVVTLAVAAAGFALWLASARLDRQVDVYEVVFRSAVSGLQNGAQVTYQGIQVGRVTRIRFDPDNVEHVLVEIEVEPTTPVTENTTARLQPQGITGIFYVQLTGASNDAERLETRAAEPAQIPGRPSTIDRLTADAPELLNRGVVLLERATELLSDDNLTRLADTLDNLDRLTTALADEEEGVAPLLSDADALLAELRDAVDAVRTTTERLDAVAQTVEADADDLMANATSGFERLNAATAELDRAASEMSGLLRDVREPMRDFSQSGLYEFTALIGETRQLVATATRITKEIERDPAGFLLGGSFKGFQAD
jgi:phospholipid/cholesterol/gamma-HCH transport system substrate-binding protein